MMRIAEKFRAGKAVFVLAVAALLLGAGSYRVSPVANDYSYDDGYSYRYGYQYNYPYRYGNHRVYGRYFGHRSRHGRKHH